MARPLTWVERVANLNAAIAGATEADPPPSDFHDAGMAAFDLDETYARLRLLKRTIRDAGLRAGAEHDPLSCHVCARSEPDEDRDRFVNQEGIL